jgi:hypothetical protein
LCSRRKIANPDPEQQEFAVARAWVATNLTFDKDVYVSVFEVRRFLVNTA